jgi:hypothetical protein
VERRLPAGERRNPRVPDRSHPTACRSAQALRHHGDAQREIVEPRIACRPQQEELTFSWSAKWDWRTSRLPCRRRRRRSHHHRAERVRGPAEARVTGGETRRMTVATLGDL